MQVAIEASMAHWNWSPPRQLLHTQNRQIAGLDDRFGT